MTYWEQLFLPQRPCYKNNNNNSIMEERTLKHHSAVTTEKVIGLVLSTQSTSYCWWLEKKRSREWVPRWLVCSAMRGPCWIVWQRRSLIERWKKRLDEDNCLAFLFFCVWASFSHRLNNHQSALDCCYSYSEWGWATEEHLSGAGGLGSLHVLDPWRSEPVFTLYYLCVAWFQ